MGGFLLASSVQTSATVHGCRLHALRVRRSCMLSYRREWTTATHCSMRHPGTQWALYIASWMRRPVLPPTLASTTAVCQRWFTTNSTGSTFQNEWSTSWLSWSVAVCRTKHQGIWSTAVLRSPTSPVDIDDQPTCSAWSLRGIDVAHSVGGPSLSGVRSSGIHCLSNYVNRL